MLRDPPPALFGDLHPPAMSGIQFKYLVLPVGSGEFAAFEFLDEAAALAR